MGGSQFEIGLQHPEVPGMQSLIWTRSQLDNDANIRMLKRRNAQGEHVYIRPYGETNLVLIDDLRPAQLARMKADGIRPALVIETSMKKGPDGSLLPNLQATIKLGPEPTYPRPVRKGVEIYLASTYEGDLKAADGVHYQRAAGLTNPKPAYVVDGLSPYVKVREASGLVTPDTARLIELATTFAGEREKRQRYTAKIAEVMSRQIGASAADPLSTYERLAQPMLAKYGEKVDCSVMDFRIATAMIKSGSFWDYQIAGAIKWCSPNIELRKGDQASVDRYIERTVARAWELSGLSADARAERDAELQAQQIDAEQARGRDRGLTL